MKKYKNKSEKPRNKVQNKGFFLNSPIPFKKWDNK